MVKKQPVFYSSKSVHNTIYFKEDCISDRIQHFITINLQNGRKDFVHQWGMRNGYGYINTFKQYKLRHV